MIKFKNTLPLDPKLSSDVKDIISFNIAHDSSVCYVRDGKVVWMIEEERLSHRKHDSYPFMSILLCCNKVPRTSSVIYTTLEIPTEKQMVEDSIDLHLLIASKVLRKNKYKCKSFYHHHHLSHASVGFYNSGFEEAVVVVVDGAGAIVNEEGHEVESIYKASYPDNFELLHQRYAPLFKDGDNSPLKNPTSGIGMAYAAASEYIGFNFSASGKTMGLAPYGQEDPNIKPFIKDGVVDEDVFARVRNGIVIEYYDYIEPKDKIDLYRLYNDSVSRCIRDENNSSIARIGPALSSPGNVEDPRNKFQLNCNIAYRMQKDFETYMIALIKKAIDISGCKNVVLSGGCALNCVANYEYLKHLPEGSKLFVEPICYDAGLSAGQAMLEWRKATKVTEIRPLKSLYLGPENKHEIPEEAYDVSMDDVIDLIEQGNPIAIFQGRSEQGPRALGNRSLLFDPRNPNAQLIMNKHKGREWWRPFAASVMLDHVHDWFDMRGLDESPFMMFAVDSHEKVWDIIPGVLHVDKTCRIQTVTREQNKNYYDLIERFYERTGIPMLLNTSFNLGGDTICEYVQDAIDTLNRSSIDYVYFPEHGKILHIPKNSHEGYKGEISYLVTEDEV